MAKDNNTDYADILEESWDEIPDTLNLPKGTWELRCIGAKYLPPKSTEDKPRVVFTYEPQEAMDDVDEDAIKELGKDYDYGENTIFHRMWYERNKDKAAVRAHVAKHGVDVAGLTFQEALKAVKNTRVNAWIQTNRYIGADGQAREEDQASNFEPIAD